MVDDVEFTIEHLGPVVEDGFRGDAVDDAEGYVDVGPFIATIKCCGAGEGTGCDAGVGLGEFEDAITDVVALLWGEHVGVLPFLLLHKNTIIMAAVETMW